MKTRGTARSARNAASGAGCLLPSVLVLYPQRIFWGGDKVRIVFHVKTVENFDPSGRRSCRDRHELVHLDALLSDWPACQNWENHDCIVKHLVHLDLFTPCLSRSAIQRAEFVVVSRGFPKGYGKFSSSIVPQLSSESWPSSGHVSSTFTYLAISGVWCSLSCADCGFFGRLAGAGGCLWGRTPPPSSGGVCWCAQPLHGGRQTSWR